MILCVTGPMAAGKNFVSDILCDMGFVSVDADLLAHDAVDLCADQILKTFSDLASQRGIQIDDGNGKINRRNLGALIFTDPALVKMQEDIVYPKITEMFDDFLDGHRNENIILNATVLYKIPLIKKVDGVIFVDAPMLVRLFRAKKRDSMPFGQILDRFRRQRNLFAKYKLSHADILKVWNTGSRKKIEGRVKKVLLKFQSRMGKAKWNKKEH